MASIGQGIPSKSSAKAPNRGGRPRKHATVEEAKAHRAEAKQKRQQPRDSKAGGSIPRALQFIPYHLPPTEPSSSRSTPTLKDEQEPHKSTLEAPAVLPPPPPLQQQAIQGIKATAIHYSPALEGLDEEASDTHPPRNENLLHPADTTIEAATILSSMPFYLPA